MREAGQPGATLEIRRSSGVLALATLGAGAMSAAYAVRAVADGSTVSAAAAAALGLIALAAALAWADARAPLLVADALGVRLRRRRSWSGLPWSDVTQVVVTRRTPGRDGSVEIVAGPTGYVVALGLATSVGPDDVALAVRTLVPDAVAVRELPRRRARAAAGAVGEPSLLPAHADLLGRHDGADLAHHGQRDTEHGDADDGPDVSASTGQGRRGRVTAALAATTVGATALQLDPHRPDRDGDRLPEARELRGVEGRPDLVFEPLPRAVAAVAHSAAPIEVAPAVGPADPVIGPRLRVARERSGLSTDQLSVRTHIRPHVIEAIEVDDFAPCGGDFYARGHLRSLARVLGLDGGELLVTYDARYSQPPVAARQVFEAELATGPHPSIRLARGGPSWAALLGVVLVLAVIWGVGRFVTDGGAAPAPAVGPTAPASTGSAAPAQTGGPDPAARSLAAVGAPTSTDLVLRGSGTGSKVVVRDADGAVVWKGRLDAGETQRLTVVGEAALTAAHGDAVAVRVDGTPRGPLGADGARATAVLGRS